MELFYYLESYRVIICLACSYGILPCEALGHLSSNHRTLSTAQRKELASQARSYPGVFQTREELRDIVYPAPTGPQIPQLRRPKDGAYGCELCPYVCLSLQAIQGHARNHHGWVNTRGKGGDTKKQPKGAGRGPWRTGVRCQRFYASGAGSSWFEVERGFSLGSAAAAPDYPDYL
jgi:hypothetical protein